MNWWDELSQLQQILAYIAVPSTLVMTVQLILSFLGLSQGADADGLDGASELGDASVDVEFDEFSLGESFADSHDGIFDIHGGGLADSIDADLANGFDVGDLDGVSADIPDGFDVGDLDGVSADVPDGLDADIVDAVSADTIDGIDKEHSSSIKEGKPGASTIKLFTLRGIIGFLAVGGWVGIVALEWGLSVPLSLGLAFVSGCLALYFVAWSIHLALRLQHSGNVRIDNAIGNTGEVYIPIPASKSGSGKINIIIQDRFTEIDAVTSADRIIKTGEPVTVMGVESEGVLIVVPKENDL